MSMIELKVFGRALLFSALTLLLLHILFQDILLLYASLSLLLALLFSLAIAARRAKWIARHLKVKPEAVSLRMTAGDREVVNVKIESPNPVKLLVNHPIRFCKIKSQPYVAGSILAIEVTPSLAGLYSSNNLEVETGVAMGLFSVKASLSLKTNIEVVPRVIPAALRAMELILSASPGGLLQEVPLIYRLGRGDEYAETREYTPGDDIRRIDWKATARLNKLMVKQFYEEVGGEVNLIYDLKVAGPASADAAATWFINLAIALSSQNLPYRITIVSSENNMETLRFSDWRKALITAVKYALKSTKVDYTYLYELVGPHSSSELMFLLKIAGEEANTNLKDTWDRGGWMDAIAVTCLIGDLTWLLDIWDRASKRGGRLIVHTPSLVWLDSPSLEQAYIDYKRQERLIKSLRRRGITVELH